jgi:hypothetical protein
MGERAHAFAKSAAPVEHVKCPLPKESHLLGRECVDQSLHEVESLDVPVVGIPEFRMNVTPP